MSFVVTPSGSIDPGFGPAGADSPQVPYDQWWSSTVQTSSETGSTGLWASLSGGLLTTAYRWPTQINVPDIGAPSTLTDAPMAPVTGQMWPPAQAHIFGD